jgi:glycosyltransferase involved in cell wall biosynthesis
VNDDDGNAGSGEPSVARSGGGSGGCLNVAVCLPAAKVSEPRVACYQRMPDSNVVVVGHESRAPADDLIRLPSWKLPYLGAPERWTASLSWLRGLGSIDLGPIDCVMSMEIYSPSSLQAHQLASRLGVPHVVTISEVLSPAPLYVLPPWRQIAKLISRSAQAFVCSVDMARESAIAAGCAPDLCAVINPGVDVDRFFPRRDGLDPGHTVCFVGELREDKGIPHVMAAARLARARFPDLRLVIAGDGPLRDVVRGEAGQNSWMEYRGKLTEDELPDFYRAARCLALAPHDRRFWAEQFGFASVEAMASGLPVVITDSGAVRQVVPEWNPICSQGDVTALAAGICAAFGPDGDTWGARNRLHAVERFDLLQEARQLREQLSRVGPLGT